jgi:hypothetical protein
MLNSSKIPKEIGLAYKSYLILYSGRQSNPPTGVPSSDVGALIL